MIYISRRNIRTAAVVKAAKVTPLTITFTEFWTNDQWSLSSCFGPHFTKRPDALGETTHDCDNFLIEVGSEINSSIRPNISVDKTATWSSDAIMEQPDALIMFQFAEIGKWPPYLNIYYNMQLLKIIEAWLDPSRFKKSPESRAETHLMKAALIQVSAIFLSYLPRRSPASEDMVG